MLSTERRKQYAWGLIGLLTAFLVVVSVYAIQTTNDAASKVESCTTPGGDCFRRQKSEREENIQRINQITVVTGWCSMTQARVTARPEYEALRRCVDAKLAKVGETEKGAP